MLRGEWQKNTLHSGRVAGWQTYRLKFLGNKPELQKEIEFEAEDAAGALMIAHREAAEQTAELWCDGRKLCTVRRSRQDVWQVNP